MGKKVLNTFLARLQKRFRADSVGPVKVIECEYLKEKLGFSDTVFEEEANPRFKAIAVLDVMIDPLKWEMAGRQKLNVPNYLKIKKNTLKLPSRLIEHHAKVVIFMASIKT